MTTPSQTADAMITKTFREISTKGRRVRVPALEIDGRTIVVTGRWLRIARVFDGEFTEQSPIDPSILAAALASAGLSADLVTSAGAIDEREPRRSHAFEWDNVAAAPCADYEAWWNGLPQVVRKNVRRAEKRGVSTMVTTLDDDLVRGIKQLYDESPMRQGRRFWHYGKSLERVREDNSTYLDRSTFIGAYFEGALIGFMKIVHVGDVARIMQILGATAHQDKRPMNAMLAKAMEVCHARGMRYLVYSKFSFGNKKPDDMAEFKKRNGFEQLDFPQYYLPVTWRGRAGFAMGVHRGLLGMLPAGAIARLSRLRRQALEFVHNRSGSVETVQPSPAQLD